MEEKKETTKKKVVKKKKEVKLTIKEKLAETSAFIDKAIKDERGKQLTIVGCAKLGKIRLEINNLLRSL